MQTAVNFKIGNEKLVKVLEGASTHLRGLLDRQGRADGALRIAVVGGGCSGLQYKMDLVDGPRDRDILVPSNGVNVVIDPKSALFVSGSELDERAALVLLLTTLETALEDRYPEDDPS